MSEANITKDLRDISFTTRDVIGYSFEVLTSKLLGRYKIEYNSNPLGSIIEWKKYQGKGVDFKIPELNIELEAKSGYARIFKSWILRDWITRFSYRNETRVIVVKPTLKLSDQCLDLLFYYNINIIYPDSISYLVKRSNKLIEAQDIQDTQKQNSKNQNREKISTVSVKIRVFYNRFKASMLNLLSNLWNNRHGSVTLVDWIPVKLKTKNKTNRARSQKIFSCPFRIILVCPYYRQFYACLIQIIDEYTSRVEKYGYNEEQIEKLVDRTILRHTWKSKNQILGKCRCKPISFIDDEISTRKPRNGIAVTEPCKKMRCSQLIKSNRCEWIELLSEHRSKPKQFKLEEFMNGDDEHG